MDLYRKGSDDRRYNELLQQLQQQIISYKESTNTKLSMIEEKLESLMQEVKGNSVDDYEGDPVFDEDPNKEDYDLEEQKIILAALGIQEVQANEPQTPIIALELFDEGSKKEEVNEKSELAEKYVVQGFPTTYFFIDGVHKPYSTQKTKDGIVTWIKKNIGTSIYNILEVMRFDSSHDWGGVASISFHDWQLINKQHPIWLRKPEVLTWEIDFEPCSKLEDLTLDVRRNSAGKEMETFDVSLLTIEEDITIEEVPKLVNDGVRAQAAMLQGINEFAEAVKVTRGPKGRKVIIENSRGNPQVTKDGVTVAKSINFEEKATNVGAALVKQVANATNSAAGNGTTCATVLTQAIYAEGGKSIVYGINVMEFHSGITMTIDAVATNLKSIAIMISTPEEMVQAATIFDSGEREMGKLIEGRGYISPYCVINEKIQKCALENPSILFQDIIDMCDFAVGLSRQFNGSIISSECPNHMMLKVWDPLGIVGVITIFNFPCTVLGWIACLALVCGNCVVWKGSPQLDAQSFDCMLPVLQSKDLIVQFLVYGIGQSQQELQTSLSSCTSQGVSYHGQDSIMVILKRLCDVFPLNHVQQLSEKEGNRYFTLNIIITEIFLSFSVWIYPSSALLEKFLEFVDYALLRNICGSMQLDRLFHDEHSVSLVAYILKLLKQVSGGWRSRILQGFTNVFKSCKPESSLKMVCISAIEEFLDPENGWLYPESSDPEILDYLVTWLMEFPSLLIQLGNNHSLSNKAVLLLQLLMGHLEGVTYLDSRGDGRYLISKGKDQTIELWDTQRMSSSGNCEPIFRKYEWDYRWMDYPHQARNLKHPNDQSVATYNGHSVLRTLIHCYSSPAQSTGQKHIHTGSHDSCIYIYDVVGGAQVAKLQHPVTIFDPGGYLIVFMMST